MQHSVTVVTGTIEIDRTQHPGDSLIPRCKIIHRRKKIELAFDAMGTECMSNLGRRIDIEVFRISQHAAEQRNVNRTVTAKNFLHCLFGSLVTKFSVKLGSNIS